MWSKRTSTIAPQQLNWLDCLANALETTPPTTLDQCTAHDRSQSSSMAVALGGGGVGIWLFGGSGVVGF
jgi:hypothetical protein